MAQSILRRARPLMAARLLSAGLTFVVPAVLARVLLPSAYGTFKQGWLLASTLALVVPMGAAASLYYFVPREPERRAHFVAQTLLWALASAALAGGLLLVGRPLVAAHFENPELTANLRLVALFTFFWIVGGPFEAALTSMDRMGRAAVVRVATEVGRGVAMLVGASLTHSVEGLFAGMAAALGLRAVLCWIALVGELGLRVSWPDFRRQLAYALPLGAAFLLIIPQQQFHQYAVGAAVSAAAFAVYAVGCFQLPIVEILYTPVSEVLQIGLGEKEHRDDHQRGLALFHEAVSRLAFVFVPAAAVLFICARELIVFVFTEQYVGAVPIFRLSLLSIAFSALPLDGVMRARAQNRFLLALSVVKLALTVGLVLGGLKLFGPIGAMGGWIAAEFLARLAMLARTATLFRASLTRVLPLRDLTRQGFATMVAVPAGWLGLSVFRVPRFFTLALCGIAFAAVYLGTLWLKGWLPDDWIPLRRAKAKPAQQA
ncbi:MAG TPA: polysaccharide biosynthesis protein [Myxococcales bacterium]|nr:polysaccharide biosynthesis protein [Myxococcales bacterium]